MKEKNLNLLLGVKDPMERKEEDNYLYHYTIFYEIATI